MSRHATAPPRRTRSLWRRGAVGAGVAVTVAVLAGSTVAATSDGRVDDSTPPAARTAQVAASPSAHDAAVAEALEGAQTLWGARPDAPVVLDPDTTAVELGTAFTPNVDGEIRGIRFWQVEGSTHEHSGSLWSPAGEQLATAELAAATGDGWQTVLFDAPVVVDADERYVASYHAPRGRYSTTENFRGRSDADDLSTGARSGVYAYGEDSRYPRSTWRSSQYWVDVIFVPAATPEPSPTPSPSVSTSTTPSPSPSSTPEPEPRPEPTASPEPTDEPTATPPGSAAGQGIVVLGRTFPNEDTTGVPHNTKLTPYQGDCSIQKDGFKIDAKVVDCDLRVLAQDVTITNSIINGTIYSDPDYFNGSFTLTDSEVRMPASSGTGIGDVNFTVTRVEVTGGSRSINCASHCTVQDSYLHGQYTDERGIDHESAIRMGSHSTIVHNTITCDASPVPPDAGCSAALTGYGDFAVVQKNTIDDNLIDGGPDGSMGYCAYGGSTAGKPYSDGVNNVKFTNNVFRRGPSGSCGIWGPITSFDSNAPGNVWKNNLWDDGKAVRAAN